MKLTRFGAMAVTACTLGAMTSARADDQCEHHHPVQAHGVAAAAADSAIDSDDDMHHAHAHPYEEHDAAGGHHHHAAAGDEIQVAASAAVVVANYDARLYEGNYQGLITGASLARGRFALAVKVPGYRILENGRELRGLGDVMVHGHAAIISRGTKSAGAMLMTSVPTGDALHGLGMGHVMVMPEVWASWSPSFLSLTGSFGYGYALGGASAHAEHGGGMWPLVDPMNARELTYAGSAVVPLTRSLAAGAEVRAATPVGSGDSRVSGGGTVVWRTKRVDTSFALQRGFVGDPFGARCTVETSLTF